MSGNIKRRSFTISSAAFLGGMLLPARNQVDAEVKDLAEKRLVLLGINALARSAEMNYFADGHRGASLISAHLM